MRERKSELLADLSKIYYLSKHYYQHGASEQECSALLEQLISLLSEVQDGARELLPFVSRINRNLTLAINYNKLNDSINVLRPARPKFVIITAVWQREALTRIFYQYYAQLARTHTDSFALSMIVAGSEGLHSQQLAESYGFEYLEVPNSPLSYKWQATADALRNRDFDAAIIVGSDDFLSASVFLEYRKLYLEGVNAAGFVDGHFYNTASNEMLYWRGYGGEKRQLGMPERVGESIGMGRLLSKDLLSLIDFQLWTGDPINKSLDRRMKENLAKIGYLHVEYEEMRVGIFKKALPYSIVILKSGDKHMLLDVKYQTNVTSFKNYYNNSEHLDFPFEEIKAHFGAELASKVQVLADSLK